MSQADSVQSLVKQFIGKESESVTVNYAGQAYSVSPKGIVTIENQLPHINEVIGSDDDYRDEMVQPILVAQTTAVRLTLLQKLHELNIKSISDVIDHYDLNISNENISHDVNHALAAVRAAVQPSFSQAAFKLFSQKSAVSKLDRVYAALQDIDAIKTYPDLQQVMAEIGGQSNDPPRMAAS